MAPSFLDAKVLGDILYTLMACLLTGDPKYEGMHWEIHEWAYKHFPDPEYGEW